MMGAINDVTYGGFFKSNIRSWIIKECLESGNPEMFWWALLDEIEKLDGEIDANPYFWLDIEKDD